MIIKKRLALMILLMVCTIILLEYKIHTDSSYHSGKDEGYFVRLEAICALSMVYFAVMSNGLKQRLLFAVAGFVSGFVSGILSYIISGLLTSFNFMLGGITFFIFSCALFMYFFFLFSKIYNKIITRFKGQAY